MTTSNSMSRRYLALIFPWLPVDRLRATRPHLFAGRDEAPLAFTQTVANAVRLTAVDLAAMRLGLQPGLTLADARARVPELEVFAHDPHADLSWLEKLADACGRYSPTVALQPPDAPLYELVEDRGPARVLTATTFGKWGPELAGIVGDGPVTVAGVATDCCVVSTVLPAADAGVPLRVVTDACAGSSDDEHDRALHLMGLYAPLVELTTTADLLGR